MNEWKVFKWKVGITIFTAAVFEIFVSLVLQLSYDTAFLTAISGFMFMHSYSYDKISDLQKELDALRDSRR